MDSTEFIAAIKALGLSQMASSRFLGVGPRTVRRWCAGESEIPKAVAMLIGLMVAEAMAPDTVEAVHGGGYK